MKNFIITEQEKNRIKSLYNLLTEQTKNGYTFEIVKGRGKTYFIKVSEPGSSYKENIDSVFCCWKSSNDLDKFMKGFESEDEAKKFLDNFLQGPVAGKNQIDRKTVQLFDDEGETQKNQIFTMYIKGTYGGNQPEVRFLGGTEKMTGSKTFQFICGNNFMVDEQDKKYYNKKYIDLIKQVLRCQDSYPTSKPDFNP